ncbi:MAG: energy-coupling factor transporter transmembrane component T [Finegoldia sp.]|nr:energy-coupling factor transporter transmembrane component T [Finegoldia sp.]
MKNDFTMGQYYPSGSIIHKLDPRVKLLFTFLYMVGIFLVDRIWIYFFILLAILAILKIAKIPFVYAFKMVRPLLPIIVITFILNILMTPGEVIYRVWRLTITVEGLRLAVFMALRLIFLVLGTSLLTLTTYPIELTDAGEKVMRPLKRFGFPAHEFAMMMTIALRFIPTLFEETDKIMKAQMARGADFESGNIIRRAKNMVPLLVPLFVNALKIAGDLAVAMEARCYRGGEGRTRLKELEYEKRDFLAYAIVIGLFLLLVLSRVL